ncbi:hypothetical protein INR49_018006 [Caranx melampygus]|nr:hypothetical protein INR49_018006 [Caranx melampygus]
MSRQRQIKPVTGDETFRSHLAPVAITLPRRLCESELRRLPVARTAFCYYAKMRTITSDGGQEETVSVRRSESADAEGIDSLISPSALAVFGRVNVIQLLEKANLAVTLANEKDDILAHAAFFDHPTGGLVDQAHWEPFLHEHFIVENCTPLNTLFLHLFVAQPDFATASVKEIMRAAFNAVAELEHVLLLRPNVDHIEPALDALFEPLQRLTDPGPQCAVLICHRAEHCPRLHIRPARVDDHDDVMHLFEHQTKLSSVISQPYFLVEVIEAQNEVNHAAVCEIAGVTVGFISVSADVDLKELRDSFDLSGVSGLYKPGADKEELRRTQSSASQQQEETQETGGGGSSDKPSAFSIEFFIIDKNYEMRSADFIPYVFKLFPDLDVCMITVPTVSPEFPLLQSFLRVPARPFSLLLRELYVFHRDGLRPVDVRPAVAADRPAVTALVEGLRRQEALLQDLDWYNRSRCGPDSVPLQAFVAQVDSRVVGVLIIRDEQDVEYLRAHYNLENFIYFSHHSYEEHARIRHFVLLPSFQHFTRHLFQEVLRLAHRSCLHHRLYPPGRSQENSCVHHLDWVLSCAVPVRPRRQIIYPLEELGINAPSRRITEDQAPFALSLLSRKLTMEPKVTVNARIVVVGASDTGLSFLEVLCCCPHLRFTNLTLISTHGLPGDHDHEDVGFLSTSHAYSSRDLAQLPLHSCVSVVTGKMVGINRKSKHVRVSGGQKVPYDHLILCTGLQYQVPCPSSVDLNQPVTNHQLQLPSAHRRFTGPVPSNLLTLNDLHDCMAARRWLCSNFVELEGNAIVYGNNIDVYTAVEALLGLGIGGARIHLVLTPPEPGASCFGDPAVQKAVVTALEKAQVRVHHGCLLAHMNNGEHPDPLTSVSFTTDQEPLHLQCAVFINLSNRGVDRDVFRSINGSHLAFDSRLVIDATFQTSDPAVRGAGPLTKFSRCYHADEWSHAHFNSKEVGQELAAAMLPLFDPTLEQPDEETQREVDRLVPLYRGAKIQGGKLPGGLNYLHVTKPSATVLTGPAVKPLKDGGIMTGRVETGNYFCLHLDDFELVETLTCLSLKPLPVSNYLMLYGKPQQLLGQLSTRYHQGLVHDLYSFFRQSSCLAVYHDRFSDFEQELQQITASRSKDGAWRQRQQQKPAEDGEDTLDTQTAAAVRSSAVKFLSYNRNLLPMFSCPVKSQKPWCPERTTSTSTSTSSSTEPAHICPTDSSACVLVAPTSCDLCKDDDTIKHREKTSNKGSLSCWSLVSHSLVLDSGLFTVITVSLHRDTTEASEHFCLVCVTVSNRGQRSAAGQHTKHFCISKTFLKVHPTHPPTHPTSSSSSSSSSKQIKRTWCEEKAAAAAVRLSESRTHEQFDSSLKLKRLNRHKKVTGQRKSYYITSINVEETPRCRHMTVVTLSRRKPDVGSCEAAADLFLCLFPAAAAAAVFLLHVTRLVIRHESNTT